MGLGLILIAIMMTIIIELTLTGQLTCARHHSQSFIRINSHNCVKKENVINCGDIQTMQ